MSKKMDTCLSPVRFPWARRSVFKEKIMAKELSVIEKEQIEFTAVSSLEKIFMKSTPLNCQQLYEISALQGENVSF